MDELMTRIYEHMIGRVHGAMTFRLFLQPIMAGIPAVLDGIKDAKAGKVPYFWALFTEPLHRKELFHSGWKSVGRTFVLGLVMDTIYQIWQLKAFYPGEAILTAFVLAIIPYLLLRGPVNLGIQKFMGMRKSARGKALARGKA